MRRLGHPMTFLKNMPCKMKQYAISRVKQKSRVKGPGDLSDNLPMEETYLASLAKASVLNGVL